MTLEQFSNIGEALGGIAVVVSLLVLAFQIRQNTQAVRVESARASEEAWSVLDLKLGIELEPDLGLKIHTADSIEEFTNEEILRTQTILRAIWHQLTSEFYLYRDGKLEHRIWERRILWFRGYVSIPVVRYFFEEEKRVLLDPELYEQIMAQTRVTDLSHEAFKEQREE